MERKPCYFYFYSFCLHVIQAVADKYQIDTEDIRNVFKKTLGKERSVVVWIDDQYFPKIEGQSFLMKVLIVPHETGMPNTHFSWSNQCLRFFKARTVLTGG